jgi:recombinational DNA repair protein (RecF pathway)
MTEHNAHEETLVLKTEPTGESFLKLHLLSVESGIFLCLKRNSKRPSSSTTPDLFDQAAVLLESSQQGTMRFVKEYQLIRRREQIGLNYHSLSKAAQFSQLLVHNAAHMPESERLFDLSSRAFDAFAAGKAPEVVLLKSLYVLLKDEGYPVREAWWPTLAPELRREAARRLKTPAPDRLERPERETCERIEAHLTRWMHHNTDLILPD